LNAVIGLQPDGVGVPAGKAGCLVQHDLVLAVQQMGGHEARHAGADDRDPDEVCDCALCVG